MSSRRCTICSIEYPTLATFQSCKVCGQDTWFHNEGVPDEDWKEQVADLLGIGEEAVVSLASLYVHPPAAKGTIYKRGDTHFIAHEELVEAGYRCLEAFNIVFVNDTFYELQGHSYSAYRLTGYRHDGGVWWIEPVEMELDLPVYVA